MFPTASTRTGRRLGRSRIRQAERAITSYGRAPVPQGTLGNVSGDTRDLLRRCLDSFATEVDGGRCEVWVVDNASSDGSAQMLRDEFPWGRLEASQENLGFGPAINLVANRTRSDWVGVANADIVLQPGAIDALLQAGEAAPGAGTIAPRLILPDGTTQPAVFTFPTIPPTVVGASGIGRAVRSLGQANLLLGMFDAER